MSERKGHVAHAHPFGDPGGFSEKHQHRPAARLPDYFQIHPTDALAPTRAQRLHAGFLGGETRGVPFGAIAESLAVGDLTGCEDALLEARPKRLQGLLDAL